MSDPTPFQLVNRPRVLSDEQIDRLADLAMGNMEMTEDDSFGPIDSIRMLDEYNDMTEGDREAVYHALVARIEGEAASRKPGA